MSELCRFDGIIIRMHFNEHGSPHFHAVSGSYRATIRIESLEITKGGLPSAQRRSVLRWARTRQGELRVAWQRRTSGQHPGKIAPPD